MSYAGQDYNIREAIWVAKHKIHSWNQMILENQPYKMEKVTEIYKHIITAVNNVDIMKQKIGISRSLELLIKFQYIWPSTKLN